MNFFVLFVSLFIITFLEASSILDISKPSKDEVDVQKFEEESHVSETCADYYDIDMIINAIDMICLDDSIEADKGVSMLESLPYWDILYYNVVEIVSEPETFISPLFFIWRKCNNSEIIEKIKGMLNSHLQKKKEGMIRVYGEDWLQDLALNDLKTLLVKYRFIFLSMLQYQFTRCDQKIFHELTEKTIVEFSLLSCTWNYFGEKYFSSHDESTAKIEIFSIIKDFVERFQVDSEVIDFEELKNQIAVFDANQEKRQNVSIQQKISIEGDEFFDSHDFPSRSTDNSTRALKLPTQEEIDETIKEFDLDENLLGERLLEPFEVQDLVTRKFVRYTLENMCKIVENTVLKRQAEEMSECSIESEEFITASEGDKVEEDGSEGEENEEYEVSSVAILLTPSARSQSISSELSINLKDSETDIVYFEADSAEGSKLNGEILDENRNLDLDQEKFGYNVSLKGSDEFLVSTGYSLLNQQFNKDEGEEHEEQDQLDNSVNNNQDFIAFESDNRNQSPNPLESTALLMHSANPLGITTNEDIELLTLLNSDITEQVNFVEQLGNQNASTTDVDILVDDTIVDKVITEEQEDDNGSDSGNINQVSLVDDSNSIIDVEIDCEDEPEDSLASLKKTKKSNFSSSPYFISTVRVVSSEKKDAKFSKKLYRRAKKERSAPKLRYPILKKNQAEEEEENEELKENEENEVIVDVDGEEEVNLVGDSNEDENSQITESEQFEDEDDDANEGPSNDTETTSNIELVVEEGETQNLNLNNTSDETSNDTTIKLDFTDVNNTNINSSDANNTNINSSDGLTINLNLSNGNNITSDETSSETSSGDSFEDNDSKQTTTKKKLSGSEGVPLKANPTNNQQRRPLPKSETKKLNTLKDTSKISADDDEVSENDNETENENTKNSDSNTTNSNPKDIRGDRRTADIIFYISLVLLFGLIAGISWMIYLNLAIPAGSIGRE